ncbi:MAG: hypothetical protein R3C39_11295 [Dehalococcoidia bacterium]
MVGGTVISMPRLMFSGLFVVTLANGVLADEFSEFNYWWQENFGFPVFSREGMKSFQRILAILSVPWFVWAMLFPYG